MTQNIETARSFLDDCESGRGWQVCRAFCHDDAGFACQADALADVQTLADYTDWMAGMFGPMPDADYEVRALAEDSERKRVVAFAVFRATHTGEGGPVPATGRGVESDYVYVMDFDGERIRHLTKIWNDGYALKQIGWA